MNVDPEVNTMARIAIGMTGFGRFEFLGLVGEFSVHSHLLLTG